MTIRLNPLLIAFVVSVSLDKTSSAHDPGFSTATVTIEKNRIDAVVTFSSEEVKSLLTNESFSDLDSLTASVLQIDNEAPVESEVTVDSDNDFLFQLTFSKPDISGVEIRSPLIGGMIPGHRQYLLVRDSDREMLLTKYLKADADAVILEIDTSPTTLDTSSNSSRIPLLALFFGISFLASMTFPLLLLWGMTRSRTLPRRPRLLLTLLGWMPTRPKRLV